MIHFKCITFSLIKHFQRPYCKCVTVYLCTISNSLLPLPSKLLYRSNYLGHTYLPSWRIFCVVSNIFSFHKSQLTDQLIQAAAAMSSCLFCYESFWDEGKRSLNSGPCRTYLIRYICLVWGLFPLKPEGDVWPEVPEGGMIQINRRWYVNLKLI